MSTQKRVYGMPRTMTREEAKDSWRGSMNSMGGLPAWHKPKKLTAEQRMEVGYLRYEGVPATEIAARFGIARPTVYNSTPMRRPDGA